MSRGVFGFPTAGLRCCAAAALAMLAVPSQAQEPEPPEVQRPPSGFRVRSVSGYGGWYALRAPGGEGDRSHPALWLASGGAATEVALGLPGQRTSAFLEYRGAYAHNLRFSALNGFNHNALFSLRTEISRRSALTFGASGNSSLVSSGLFTPTRSLDLAQQASSPDELAAGLMQDGYGIASSPFELTLSGARHTSGSVHAGFNYVRSERLAFSASVGVTRTMRAGSRDVEFAARYPSITIGVASGTARYLISRRTHVYWTGGYTRAYSPLYRFHWESAGIGLQRYISRRTYAFVEAGYGRMSSYGSGRPGRNGYNTRGGLGTIKGYHRLVIRFRRQVGDFYGLGADNAFGAEGGWAWARLGSPWSVAAGSGYERLGGRRFASINARVFHAMVTRQLTRQLSIAFSMSYASDSLGNATDLARRGFQMSIAWVPEGAWRRRR